MLLQCLINDSFFFCALDKFYDLTIVSWRSLHNCPKNEGLYWNTVKYIHTLTSLLPLHFLRLILYRVTDPLHEVTSLHEVYVLHGTYACPRTRRNNSRKETPSFIADWLEGAVRNRPHIVSSPKNIYTLTQLKSIILHNLDFDNNFILFFY